MVSLIKMFASGVPGIQRGLQAAAASLQPLRSDIRGRFPGRRASSGGLPDLPQPESVRLRLPSQLAQRLRLPATAPWAAVSEGRGRLRQQHAVADVPQVLAVSTVRMGLS